MPTRAEGKRIDTWQMSHETQIATIDVRIRNDYGYGNSKVEFLAVCKSLDLELIDTDINNLRAKMQSAVKEKLALKYVPMLIVSFDKTHSSRARGGYWHEDGLLTVDKESGELELLKMEYGFEIEVEACEIADTGKVQSDGRKLRRKKRERGSWHSEDYRREPGDPTGNLTGGLLTELPDTIANRQALQLILDGFEALDGKLRELLNPKKLAKNLKAINDNGLKLLPARTEKE